MPRHPGTLLPLILALVPLAGCGGGESDAIPAQNRTIGVKLSEYRITPGRIVAPAGKLRLIARNEGILTHNVVVQRVPDDPGEEPEALGRTDTLHPGERAETEITLKPGTYRMVCTLGNHDDLGQYGTLIVR